MTQDEISSKVKELHSQIKAAETFLNWEYLTAYTIKLFKLIVPDYQSRLDEHTLYYVNVLSKPTDKVDIDDLICGFWECSIVKDFWTRYIYPEYPRYNPYKYLDEKGDTKVFYEVSELPTPPKKSSMLTAAMAGRINMEIDIEDQTPNKDTGYLECREEALEYLRSVDYVSEDEVDGILDSHFMSYPPHKALEIIQQVY